MDDCVFCKIIKGEIPCNKLYEDEFVIAFYDINPSAPVHFLVIPKMHIACAEDISTENSFVITKIFEVIVKLTKELGLTDGYRIVNNCRENAGQTVFHIHFHVLAGAKFNAGMV